MNLPPDLRPSTATPPSVAVRRYAHPVPVPSAQERHHVCVRGLPCWPADVAEQTQVSCMQRLFLWRRRHDRRLRRVQVQQHPYLVIPFHQHPYSHEHPTHTRTHIYIYIHAHAHIRSHTYIHTYIHTHIHTRSHTHTYIHTYTHIHTHTHTHTHTSLSVGIWLLQPGGQCRERRQHRPTRRPARGLVVAVQRLPVPTPRGICGHGCGRGTIPAQ